MADITVRQITELLALYTNIEIWQDRKVDFNGEYEYVPDCVYSNTVGKMGKCEYYSSVVSYMKIQDSSLYIKIINIDD